MLNVCGAASTAVKTNVHILLHRKVDHLYFGVIYLRQFCASVKEDKCF